MAETAERVARGEKARRATSKRDSASAPPRVLPAYVRRELALPRRPIGPGSRGGDVRKVQEWLCHHGHGTVVDGDFGPATGACLRAFQTAHSLEPGGTLDAPTWETLVRPLAEAIDIPDPDALAALSPFAAVRQVAERHLERRPIEIGGANRGPWVRLYCDGADGSAWAWCAGFVSQIVRQAYEVRPERAPILGSVSCDTLAAQATTAGHFVHGRDVLRDPRALRRVADGAIFLRRRTPTDWVHAGFATGFERDADAETAASVRGEKPRLLFRTIEGNTNDEGHRDGYEACRRIRSLAGNGYDFIAFDPPPPA